MKYIPLALAVLLLAPLDAVWQSAPEARGGDVKPARVVITPDDPASVQRGIQTAIRTGQNEVTIPPGIYKLPPLPTGGGPDAWHLVIENARNLEIKATGVTFVFTDRFRSAMTLQKCENVIFRGATLTRETSPSSQGRIEALSPENNTVDVRIAKGYPTDVENPKSFEHIWLLIFDPTTRQWKTELRASSHKDVQRLAPDLIRVKTEKHSTAAVPVAVGDLVAWRGTVYTDLRAFECGRMRFIDVTVKGGTGFCFQDSGGEGGNCYERCKVMSAPRPSGAVDDPLLAANADGLHSMDTRKGPTVVACSFEGLNDDAIAIHGTYAMALEATGNKVIALRIGATRNKMIGRIGDKLRFYDKDIVYAGEATIAEVKKLSGYQSAFDPGPRYSVFRSKNNIAYIELTLDREVPAQASWLISNENECGGGFLVKNCTIRNTTARGVFAQSSPGMIEGCMIEATGRAAVEFNTETGIWSQADYSRDVVVRDNTFRDVSRNRKTGLLRHPGALTIFASRGNRYIRNPGGHRNITVENNRFEDNNGINIMVCSAEGVTIRNNQFINPMRDATDFGMDKGADPSALIWVNESSKVSIVGNEVVNGGACLKKTVGATSTGSGTGFDTGVKIRPSAAKHNIHH